MIEITPIPAFNDNYIWLLTKSHSNQAWVVDPGDAAPVLESLQLNNLTLAGILLTHHHADHTGGVATLLQHTQVPVIGPANSRIQDMTRTVTEGEEIEVLGAIFKVIEVPGHTLDHIAYYSDAVGEQPAVFCGDTLFAGGCGRLFEGGRK